MGPCTAEAGNLRHRVPYRKTHGDHHLTNVSTQQSAKGRTHTHTHIHRVLKPQGHTHTHPHGCCQIGCVHIGFGMLWPCARPQIWHVLQNPLLMNTCASQQHVCQTVVGHVSEISRWVRFAHWGMMLHWWMCVSDSVQLVGAGG